MKTALVPQEDGRSKNKLLDLYHAHMNVKRELRFLKNEHLYLIGQFQDREKDWEEAQEQVERLGSILSTPRGTANAMVYFRLKRLWRVATKKLERFATEFEAQRLNMERRYVRKVESTKKQKALEKLHSKLEELLTGRDKVLSEAEAAEQQLVALSGVNKLLHGYKYRSRVGRLSDLCTRFQLKIDGLEEAQSRILDAPIEEPNSLSLSSRRMVNIAVIAFAQLLVQRFSKHDMAYLSKFTSLHQVHEIEFGDQAECVRLAELIGEEIDEFRLERDFTERVQARMVELSHDIQFDDDEDSLPNPDVADMRFRAPAGTVETASLHGIDVPKTINVLTDRYWNIELLLR